MEHTMSKPEEKPRVSSYLCISILEGFRSTGNVATPLLISEESNQLAR